MELLKKLTSVELNHYRAVDDYINDIFGTGQQLEDIGFPVHDRLITGLMLKGLPNEFQPFIMSISNCGATLSSDFVKSRTLQTVLKAIPIKTSQDIEAMAVKAKRSKCSYCGKRGHLEKNCKRYGGKER